MEIKRTATALVLFLCTVFLLWWAASSIEIKSSTPTDSSPVAASSYMVLIYHSVQDSMHVYEGSIPASACQAVSAGGKMNEQEPSRLSLQLALVDSPACPGSGASAISQEPFSIAISAREGVEPVIDKISINGNEVAFSVIEE